MTVERPDDTYRRRRTEGRTNRREFVEVPASPTRPGPFLDPDPLSVEPESAQPIPALPPADPKLMGTAYGTGGGCLLAVLVLAVLVTR